MDASNSFMQLPCLAIETGSTARTRYRPSQPHFMFVLWAARPPPRFPSFEGCI